MSHHDAPVRLPNVTSHRTRSLSRADVIVIDHIPCTNLARTACDLAPSLTRDNLVRMIDDIQRRGSSMQWLMHRATRLSSSGRAGPNDVLDIVRRRLHGYRVPDSWFERVLRTCLESERLSDMTRQYVLQDAHGEFVARFDLAVPWARLGIEGHSRSYHLGELAERYDEDRDLRAAKEGWEIMYLGFAATRAPAAVRRDIEAVVERRASDFDLALPNRQQRLWLP
ncbi:MAG: hypothetical protein JWN62_1495 [Acidimicrobiales bacterium]|nr:hypothetical protein [Acidimicrobiales bacterium]